MIILGIDPGTTRVGYGFIEKNKNKYIFKKAGLIETKGNTPEKRLIEIKREISSLIKKIKPTKVGIEKLFFAKNKKTAMRVSEARGVIILTIAEKHIPLIEISPNKVKIEVTGNGIASKQAVAKMVGYILNIDTKKYIDDTTDALAIAISIANK